MVSLLEEQVRHAGKQTAGEQRERDREERLDGVDGAGDGGPSLLVVQGPGLRSVEHTASSHSRLAAGYGRGGRIREGDQAAPHAPGLP